MKHTLEAVRRLLKEKIYDAYAFKCATALRDLGEKELDGISTVQAKPDSSPQGEP